MLRRFLAILLLCLPAMAMAEGRTMIVLDASGSMWGQIGGRTKVEIAREVLGTVLAQVPPETELGLVVYGHRTRGDCADIEVAVPAGPGTAQAIIDFANSARFLGKTPLTDAVRVAAEALRATEEKATVILITDGIETCNADPCALGAELEASGVDFTAHVVGFGLTEEEGRAVACLAEATGGTYLPAADAAALGAALTRTVAAPPEPEPSPDPAPAPEPEPEPAALTVNLAATAALAEGAEDLDADIFWELLTPAGETVHYAYGARYETKADPGDYVLRMRIDQVSQERPVTLKADALAEEHFVLNAGVLTLTGRRTEGGEPDGDIYVEAKAGEATAYGYGSFTAVMPAGELVLTGRQAASEATRTVTLAPGERLETDIVVGSGVAAVAALYAPGGPPVEGDAIFLEVASAAQKIDGSRDRLAYRYGPGPMDVPAGDYVILARLGQAEAVSAPFSVAAGGRTEVQVVLNAGVAAISAPGAQRIDILGKAPDIQGNRPDFGQAYGETHQETLPAGSYVAVADYGGARPPAEKAFAVAAGARVEVTLP
ncbi:MAG: VWA domain-containing protein [Rhodobacteraceae bacterium]|nr:VWA domain-containing protein [Paracoccaceae bacterium]